MRKTNGRFGLWAVALISLAVTVSSLTGCGKSETPGTGGGGQQQTTQKLAPNPQPPEGKTTNLGVPVPAPAVAQASLPASTASADGKSFTEDLGGGVTLDMVWVKEGTFQMGSPESEKDRGTNEGPQTDVTVAGFLMGKYEVTQEQYEKVMGTNPSDLEGPKNPVETVSWNDAMEFCKKLSASKAGRTYTLPTEAQWEYACRAGSTGRFCFGDSDNDLGSYAWIQSNSDAKTHPVGQKTANAWGLYDMHGNVWEWCLSQYQPYPYKEDDGRSDASGSGLRVLRGGSCDAIPRYCRSAGRGDNDPSFSDVSGGFRVVCVGPSPRR